MDVVTIAKAVIALITFLEGILAALKERANESQRQAIGEAIAAYETAKTEQAKEEDARKIQDSFRDRSK
jgi:hypothetical protein